MDGIKKKPSGRIVRTADEQTFKLPILGKIRTGERRTIQKADKKTEIPTSLDYFKATGKFAARFHEACGDKPDRIGIIFVSDDMSEVCNERYELRDEGGKLLGYGDGTSFHLWSKPDKCYLEKIPDTEEKRAKLMAMGKWDIVLTLRFIIPKVKGIFGLWAYETKGKASSIPNIRDTFDNVMNMAKTVINIPFDLTVEKVKSQKPGDTNTFPVVNLIPNIEKDRLDDVRDFLEAGNSVRDVKGLLSGHVPAPQQLQGGNIPAAQIGAPQNESAQNNENPKPAAVGEQPKGAGLFAEARKAGAGA